MNDSNHYLSAEALVEPRVFTSSNTLGHAPFFFWLTSVLKPRVIVELGSAHGFAFFVFCQAARRLGIGSQCYAVDTWKGDLNTGSYGNQVYESVAANLREHFGASDCHLLRMEFSAALPIFKPGSVDLLFIDGCHTYDAVRSDFLMWRAKMSDRAVVLFHDTQVVAENFGVKKFWGEISAEFPSIEFHHDHGLGVLMLGAKLPETLSVLGSETDATKAEVRGMYARLGEKYNVVRELAAARAETSRKEREMENMRSSLSWKITTPLRLVHSFCGNFHSNPATKK